MGPGSTHRPRPSRPCPRPPSSFPSCGRCCTPSWASGRPGCISPAPSRLRSRGLWLYFLQLAVNFVWPLLFFGLQAYGPALVWLVILWGLIWGMLLAFRRADPLAGWLQAPYLLWVSFAACLNWGVWRLN